MMLFTEMEKNRRGHPGAYGVCFCFYNTRGRAGIAEFVFNSVLNIIQIYFLSGVLRKEKTLIYLEW